VTKPQKPQVNLHTVKYELQKRYREAMDKALAARSPEERSRWAAEAAVAISELQHPSFA